MQTKVQPVIMNKMDYIQGGNLPLNNPNYYRNLDSPIYPETAIQIDNILKRMFKECLITEKQYTFLATPLFLYSSQYLQRIGKMAFALNVT